MKRRLFLQSALAAAAGPPIDRRALVQRHNPIVRALDPLAPLSVGNGEFAFTADPTGLQTFPEDYEKGIPLCTQSQWGWHSFPRVPGTLHVTPFDTHGRPVGYATSAGGQKELFNWLRENPHRLHLGRIGLRLNKAEVADLEQSLDLWTGILHSTFRAKGTPVTVDTCCHPALDLVAVRVRSAAPLAVVFEFPYGSPQMNAADWTRPERHRTVVSHRSANRLDLTRELDQDRYFVSIGWEGGAGVRQEAPHRFVLDEARDFVCRFSPRPAAGTIPSVDAVFEAGAKHWADFWTHGGALDLAAGRDPRAKELERRVVLSQYLTAIQCAGSLPPQETGLTCNSWYGKFHLEMHWWHAAHFAQWNRLPLLERSLGWYSAILPCAREKAKDQGYTGARWPKMVGPDGRDSPSPIGPLLIWQQPHPILYAELCYRAHPDRETLARHRDVVFDSAEFMASFAFWDGGRYVLGPPVIPAQENHPPNETWNPTFELEYWAHALGIAGEWRKRLGLAPEPRWERVRARLSALPVKDGVYLAHENCPRTFTERNRDHPSMLAACGVLPGEKVDRETMRRTLRKVLDVWRWPDTWGWDYPMVAMTAARLGERETAVDALLMDTPKNRWLPNGHNWQRPNLPLYLPGNGGLLAAVAMMAAGWRGGPSGPAPGFPSNWTVRQEDLRAYDT